ncbi:protein of unknown function [Agreia sp. COWG]|nr:protein of unknown function [Agreia sp. COWG]
MGLFSCVVFGPDDYPTVLASPRTDKGLYRVKARGTVRVTEVVDFHATIFISAPAARHARDAAALVGRPLSRFDLLRFPVQDGTGTGGGASGASSGRKNEVFQIRRSRDVPIF